MIEENNVEVITLVPLMLQRILQNKSQKINSLKCIISGGARLSESLIKETMDSFSPILFNLYGTTEAGFCIMATPKDLIHFPSTIGKPIKGVNFKILNPVYNEVMDKNIGQIFIKSRWTVKDKFNDGWIATGDLGYMDDNGYCFLCGRVDDMIVSGGENVYPHYLENFLLSHPKIEDAAVIGIVDIEYGERLKCFVVVALKETLEESEISNWLSKLVPRYCMPKEIKFLKKIPSNLMGKTNKIILESLR